MSLLLNIDTFYLRPSSLHFALCTKAAGVLWLFIGWATRQGSAQLFSFSRMATFFYIQSVLRSGIHSSLSELDIAFLMDMMDTLHLYKAFGQEFSVAFLFRPRYLWWANFVVTTFFSLCFDDVFSWGAIGVMRVFE